MGDAEPGGGVLAGPVTITDTGTSGTDVVTIVGTPGDDALVQTASGFTLNGTAINVTGVEAATVDGGGGTGDTFTVTGTRSTLPMTSSAAAASSSATAMTVARISSPKSSRRPR